MHLIPPPSTSPFLQGSGHEIYSVGYALGSSAKCTTGGFHSDNGNELEPVHSRRTRCVHFASDDKESPTINSYSTLSQIASLGDFYNQPQAAELDTIFAAIAADISQGSSRLVDDNY